VATKNILVTRKYNNQIFLVAKPCGDKKISIATGYDNQKVFGHHKVRQPIFFNCQTL
jgi:hypothetical protein